ncbi:MAG: hypothetical protein ACRD4Q_10300 [Candidatus Acidiferrales bacterium]
MLARRGYAKFFPALGGNHALRTESLPDIGAIPLAVELGVGPYQADPCLLGSRLDDGRQIRPSFQGQRRAIWANKNC